ncbi:cytochrome b5-related protein-like [Galleria mellonella]|uniref:Cytochrome b5-related protein n=1 Tax=Galleria mellonella TaxID=7137 RepID=A0A6J1WL66_GALME|nr:cytochrome b5-related protein-like [Galleria mellonella]
MAPRGENYLEIAHQRAIEKKTHVSFPQLKYPSLRDEGLKDPVQWLTGKAMDDGAEGLWRVHDKIYDLTTFIKQHPGGAEWLELSKGTDITEAYEVHHLNPSINNILEKYYVKPAVAPRNSPFTFKKGDFYDSLKKDVVEELKKIPKHVATRTNKIIDGLLITLLISSTLSCYSNNYWIRLVSYLVASLSMAWAMVASHNYIHRKNNWRMYVFNVGLWSYRDFRVSHVLSHHLFPNTLMDLEISAFEPLVHWIPRRNVPKYANLAFLFENIVFPFLFIITFLKRFFLNFIRKDYFKNHYRWHDVIGLTIPLWMWLTSGAPFHEVFTTWLWINCTASFIFFTIGSNAAHHHPKLFHDGDELREPTRDWGIHEVESVIDRTDINDNLFKVMTFFGDHTLHHLFPTLDHGLLPHFYPALLKNVEKFKVKFRTTTQFELFIQQIKVTMKREPNLLSNIE